MWGCRQKMQFPPQQSTGQHSSPHGQSCLGCGQLQQALGGGLGDLSSVKCVELQCRCWKDNAQFSFPNLWLLSGQQAITLEPNNRAFPLLDLCAQDAFIPMWIETQLTSVLLSNWQLSNKAKYYRFQSLPILQDFRIWCIQAIAQPIIIFVDY